MADTMTPEQRHRCMAAIRSNDTKPEMLVRRYLHALGYRYGLHNKKLPGSPDIVLRRLRTVIFINGCFWHGHDNCKYYRLPKTNPDFWRTKIEANRARDARTTSALRTLGWHVIVIWGCQLKTEELRTKTLRELADTLRRYSGQGAESLPSIAAEPEVSYE